MIAEQGEQTGLQLLLEGEARALLLGQGGGEPVGRQRAPTWIGAIAVLTGGPMGVRMQARDRLPARDGRPGGLPPLGVRAARRSTGG